MTLQRDSILSMLRSTINILTRLETEITNTSPQELQLWLRRPNSQYKTDTIGHDLLKVIWRLSSEITNY